MRYHPMPGQVNGIEPVEAVGRARLVGARAVDRTNPGKNRNSVSAEQRRQQVTLRVAVAAPLLQHFRRCARHRAQPVILGMLRPRHGPIGKQRRATSKGFSNPSPREPGLAQAPPGWCQSITSVDFRSFIAPYSGRCSPQRKDARESPSHSCHTRLRRSQDLGCRPSQSTMCRSTSTTARSSG